LQIRKREKCTMSETSHTHTIESESLLPSVQTGNGWRARALTTLDCELSAKADIVELVLMRVFTRSLSGYIFMKIKVVIANEDVLQT